VISIECFGEGWWKSYFSERRLVKNFFLKRIQEIYLLITDLGTMLAGFQ
jgi:hypothetical protein